MAFVEWKEAFSVFHGQLDNDHQKIIKIINSLFQAMKEKKEGETLYGILTDLLEYTKTHFAREEAVMQELEYPGLRQHRDVHTKMTQRTEELLAKYQHGDEHLSQELLSFLKEWWINHVLTLDRGYVPFITRSLGLQPPLQKYSE
jgi:hemerythrin-like metal-binding protein